MDIEEIRQEVIDKALSNARATLLDRMESPPPEELMVWHPYSVEVRSVDQDELSHPLDGEPWDGSRSGLLALVARFPYGREFIVDVSVSTYSDKEAMALDRGDVLVESVPMLINHGYEPL